MTTRILALRVLPPPLVGLRAQRLIERNMLVSRRAWMIVVSGFFEPVFYLLSLGIGMSRLVGEVAGPGGTTLSYAAFVAPALLAASAMNGAVFESTITIFVKLRYGKIYDAILATPLRPWDIAIGEITWSLLRGILYSTGFVVVMAVMGLVTTPLAILAIPAATLIGFAFGAVGMAATTFMRSWQDFDLVMLVMLPLFLFSATSTWSCWSCCLCSCSAPRSTRSTSIRRPSGRSSNSPRCITGSSSSGLSPSAPSTSGSSATWPT